MFHQDDVNFVIGYHRWDHGGEGDDTIVIVNFSGTHLKEYRLQLPIAGNCARFNSSWKGYEVIFQKSPSRGIHTGEDRSATIGPHRTWLSLHLACSETKAR